MDIKKILKEYQPIIDKKIKELVPTKIDQKWINKYVKKIRWQFEYDSINKGLVNPIWNFLNRGGKRWRPVLLLLCCEIVGGNEKDAIDFVALPELIHNGTLLVDDIEDKSSFRRGKKSLHLIYGEDIAINTGNAMYYLPTLLIRESSLSDEKKCQVYELINKEMLKLHLGQGMDIYWHKNIPEVTEEEYLQMCSYKTGTLARLSARLGAILGNATKKQEKLLGEFAETIGVAFQIQDDIMNIESAQKLGKTYGDDITEGKISLIVIHTFKNANKKDKERLKEILRKHTRDKILIYEAIDIIGKYESLEYAKKRARELVKEAWEEITKEFKRSSARDKLEAFAKFLIEREV